MTGIATPHSSGANRPSCVVVLTLSSPTVSYVGASPSCRNRPPSPAKETVAWTTPPASRSTSTRPARPGSRDPAPRRMSLTHTSPADCIVVPLYTASVSSRTAARLGARARSSRTSPYVLSALQTASGPGPLSARSRSASAFSSNHAWKSTTCSGSQSSGATPPETGWSGVR